SVGVKRQYCGALGKIGNCQVAVSSALIADGRPWPLAIDLYLPAEWLAEDDRRAAAGIPDTVVFREKWRMALTQVRTALKAGFQIEGVVADADYGSTAAFRTQLERLGLRYGVAIRGALTLWTAEAQAAHSAAALADAIPVDQWQPVTWGTGTKGPLAGVFLELAVRPWSRRAIQARSWPTRSLSISGSPSRGARGRRGPWPGTSSRCAYGRRRRAGTGGCSASKRRTAPVGSTTCSISRPTPRCRT